METRFGSGDIAFYISLISDILHLSLPGLTGQSRGHREPLWPPLDATVKPWHDKMGVTSLPHRSG
jgi:hypothetical protein